MYLCSYGKLGKGPRHASFRGQQSRLLLLLETTLTLGWHFLPLLLHLDLFMEFSELLQTSLVVLNLLFSVHTLSWLKLWPL